MNDDLHLQGDSHNFNNDPHVHDRLRLESLMAIYVEYWKRPAAPPKTFRLSKELFKKLNWEWVFMTGFAANGNLDSERYYFENMFGMVESNEDWKFLFKPEVIKAQESEAQSRIYRSIHK